MPLSISLFGLKRVISRFISEIKMVKSPSSGNLPLARPLFALVKLKTEISLINVNYVKIRNRPFLGV